MSETLYDGLGGEPAVDATVDLFYRKVRSDTSISHFFDTTTSAAEGMNFAAGAHDDVLNR